jgi:hypothetical protein
MNLGFAEKSQKKSQEVGSNVGNDCGRRFLMKAEN